jgi:hypothetical protein
MTDITIRSIYPSQFAQNNKPLPNRIVILMIDLQVKDKDVILEFSRGSLHKNVCDADIKKIFSRVVAGDKKLFPKIKKDAESGKRLAADGECLTCFVIRLSDSIHWQFMRKNDPMMGYEDFNLNMFATNPNRIDKNGQTELDDCKTAYFVVDGTACRDQVIKTRQNENGNYSLPYNLNVELYYTIKGTKYFIPIIIDPEVIWPGGTKPS